MPFDLKRTAQAAAANTLNYSFSATVGTAIFASVVSSLYQYITPNDDEAVLIHTGGAILGLCGIICTYYFDGPAIYKHITGIESDDSETIPLMINNQTEKKRAAGFNLIKQLLFTTVDFLSLAFSTGFLFMKTINYSMWALIATGVDLIFKQPFNLLTEAYETNEELSGDVKQPFYASLFKLSGKNSMMLANYYILLACIDHIAVDDLLPLWIWLDILRHTLDTPGLALSIGIVAILGIIGLVQTYGFEGRNALENLKEINPNTTIANQDIPLVNGCKSFFQRFPTLSGVLLESMSLLHGAQYAAPIYVLLSDVYNVDKYISFGCSTLPFFIGAIGTHYSEVEEAKSFFLTPPAA